MAFLAKLPADSGIAPYLLEAAVMNGVDPHTWPPGHPALDAVLAQVDATASPQNLLRPLYALGLAKAVPAGLADRVRAGFHDGQFGEPARRNDDIWAILALHVATSPAVPDAAVAAARGLASQQDASGGWSWQAGGNPDVDTTGMAMEALVDMHLWNASLAERAIAYLDSQADPGGGFPTAAGRAPNCDSTVWAIRGYRIAAHPWSSAAWAFLHSLQTTDGGFSYQPGQPSNAICTAEVVALMGSFGQGTDASSSGPVHSDPPAELGLATGAIAAIAWRRRGSA